MKLATISQAKNQFSAYIELVRNGETVIVTDRDRPVARIEPIIASAGDSDEARLERLERSGVIKRAAREDGEDELEEPPAPIAGGDILIALLAERDAAR